MNMTLRTFIVGLCSLAGCLTVRGADPQPLENEALGKIKLGTTAAELTALIGKPESKGKDTEWGATGEWVQEWRFKKQGLTLNLASEKEGGAKTVLSITAVSPSKLSTARGIHVGSTAAEVANAYADVQDKEQSKPGQSFVAGSIYGGVIFTFTAGKVSEIFIGAAAE